MGQSDQVSASIQVKDNAVDPAKVIFKTPQGTEYQADYNAADQTYQLRVVAGPAGDVQELYALYPAGNGKYWNLGKLSIASYAPQSHKVVLVPVNGTPVDEAAVRQALAAVYGPLGISWQVEKAADYTYPDNARLMEQPTGLATYNALMQALNGQYQQDRAAGFDKGANYLFFLKATGSGQLNDRSATGFMPRGGQFGYLFTSEIANAEEAVTVAHELGHGRWKLYHTFDGHYGGYKQGETDNVMDYANGGHLAKWQWDLMSDPAMLVSVFESDEDAMLADRLVACLTGAAVDVGLQYTFKWVELWMEDKPVPFSDYNTIFAKLDASQVAVSATISCGAAMLPIVPSTKGKLLVAVVAGLGEGANAFGNNVYVQYDELARKHPEASVGELMGKVQWSESIREAGVGFAITSIATGVTLYARGNPKFVSFAHRLQEKINRQGTAFLEKAGLNKEAIELLCQKLGVKFVKEVVVRRIDDYIPTSGTRLIGNADKTTTILGRWEPDMKAIITKMLPNDFNVGTGFGVPENKGGFNFLHIPNRLIDEEVEFFESYNKRWLQKAIERGDDIVLATRPMDMEDFVDLDGALKGIFALELKFLVRNNYKPVNLSKNEWNNIKKWFEL